jgi:hypothetical protein
VPLRLQIARVMPTRIRSVEPPDCRLPQTTPFRETTDTGQGGRSSVGCVWGDRERPAAYCAGFRPGCHRSYPLFITVRPYICQNKDCNNKLIRPSNIRLIGSTNTSVSARHSNGAMEYSAIP